MLENQNPLRVRGAKKARFCLVFLNPVRVRESKKNKFLRELALI